LDVSNFVSREWLSIKTSVGIIVAPGTQDFEQDIGVERMAYHCKHWTDQAVVDKGVDAAILHHGPGVFRGWKIGFAV